MSKTFRGPTGSQAFVLTVTAIGLLVTGCFGVFGLGLPMTAATQDALGPMMLTLAGLYAFGLLSAIVACVVAIVRNVRHGPLYDETVDTAPARPGFAQGFFIVLAAIILFSGTCFTVVSNNPRPRSGIGPVVGLLVLIAILASLAGCALMWGRAMATRRTTQAPDTSLTKPAARPED